MMTHNDIDAIKFRYVALYSSYLSALSGTLSDELLHPVVPTSSHERVSAIAGRHQDALTTSMMNARADVTKVAESAKSVFVTDPQIDAVVRTFTSALCDDMINSIIDQAGRDKRAAAQFAIQVMMGVALDGNVTQRAVSAYADKQFKFMDRAGKRWKSERFVMTAIDIALYRAYNETLLYTAHKNGIDRFSVSYQDPAKEKSAKIFAFEDYCSESMQSYVFHPNSGALVIVV